MSLDDCKNSCRAYTESTVLYLYDVVTGFLTDRRDKDRCVHTCARYKGELLPTERKIILYRLHEFVLGDIRTSLLFARSYLIIYSVGTDSRGCI